MNLDARIRTALTGICDVIVPQVYTGDATEYIVFNYYEYPLAFADDAPQSIGYSVQVHLFMPLKANPHTKKKQIKQALESAGFTYPSVTDATDADGGHFVFECEYADGDV